MIASVGKEDKVDDVDDNFETLIVDKDGHQKPVRCVATLYTRVTAQETPGLSHVRSELLISKKLIS